VGAHRELPGGLFLCAVTAAGERVLAETNHYVSEEAAACLP
jgi:hypothetical protein